MRDRDPVEQLVEEGLLRHEGGRVRTTARWQAALARAALQLQRSGAPWVDVRLPIAAALLERLPDVTDEALAERVEAMLPIELAELAPVSGAVAKRDPASSRPG